MSGTHHFHVGAAIEVGVNAAIILEQFDFYITKNKANGRHYHDGRYWTYNSVSAFKDMYPYMSEKSIRTAISKLVDGGYVLVGDYNKNRYQRPKWYSVTDKGYRLLDESYRPKGQHVLPETAERDTQNGNSHIVSSSYSSTSSSYISSELPNREKHPTRRSRKSSRQSSTTSTRRSALGTRPRTSNLGVTSTRGLRRGSRSMTSSP